MASTILAMPDGTRLMILAPVIEDRKGEYLAVFDEIRRQGFVRVRVDGEVRDLDETITLEKNKKHTIEVVVDRVIVRHDEGSELDENPDRVRIIDSLETALRIGNGQAVGQVIDGEALRFSEKFACVHCGLSFGELEPRNFSFNSPHGACPTCTGLGTRLEFAPELIVPNRNLSLAQGAIMPWMRAGGDSSTWYFALLNAMCEKHGQSMDVPFCELPKDFIDTAHERRKQKVTVRYKSGSGRWRSYDVPFEGVIPNLQRRLQNTTSDYVQEELGRYKAARLCPTCKGARLKPEARAVLVDGKGDRRHHDACRAGTAAIASNSCRPIRTVDPGAPLTEREYLIARQILKEIRERLGFLVDVGLDYLTLDRSATTLSGGEAQRIRLATQIGSSLMGVLYILDEPSIGLHQRDNERLIRTLERLRDIGNTLIVVEHDEDMMRAADWIIDIGPGAGVHGGHVVAAGTLADIAHSPESITGQYLTGERRIDVPMMRRPGNGKFLESARSNGKQPAER